MEKTTKKAKVIYNKIEDSFEIWINTGDGWGFSQSWKCKARQGGDSPDYIHFSFVNALINLQGWGYKISFRR